MVIAPLSRGAVPLTPALAAGPSGEVALGPSAIEKDTVAAGADLLLRLAAPGMEAGDGQVPSFGGEMVLDEEPRPQPPPGPP
eukprot:10735019-Alexandrium_andersonii.AAC.1